ncbi:MAG: outer membrane beta-barrel domain-containing protein [Gammaproteobacteria bacterium]|nr:outer membrane beta-barrel domain-containing protein [Gammaproteobacteria bacterium]
MFKRIFSRIILFTLACAALINARAATDADAEFRLSGKPLLYEPEVERRPVHLANIDSEYVEFGPYAGLLSVEDFGANVVTGWRLVLHPLPWLFVEGARGTSAVSDETFRKNFSFPIFQDGQLTALTYSYVALGWNLMPGEIFLGRSLALTSGVYVLGGAGRTEFNHESWPTIVYGMGLRVLPIDWIALHLDVRGLEFQSSLLGRRKMTHNVELNVGASVYF